jgi:hypothetical protein
MNDRDPSRFLKIVNGKLWEGSPHQGPAEHGGASAVLPSLIRRGGVPSGAAALLAHGGMGASAPINLSARGGFSCPKQ